MPMCGARSARDTLGVGGAVSFVENIGQWSHPARFEAQLRDGAVFVEDGCLTVALRDPIPHPSPGKKELAFHAYRMSFVGCHKLVPTGDDALETYSNYYLGNDPSRWRSGVGEYARVMYRELYSGVDLEVISAKKALKYNFVVKPHADTKQIVVRYEGTDGVVLTREGDLRIKTSVRDIVELKPYVYQMIDGQQKEIASRWAVERKHGSYEVRVEVGEYAETEELVIDPMLVFSTYTGATADNWGATATYDVEKNVYTAGLVFGVGYPTSLGAYSVAYNGGTDVGIFKFDSLGTQRMFATYLGGASADMPHSMYVNGMNELLVFGTTGSGDFPVTPGAYSTRFNGGSSIYYESYTINYPNGSDIFVSRFSADGRQLQASTYVGGSGNDGLNYRSYYNNNYMTVMNGNDSLYYNYGDGARGELITDDQNNVYIGSTTMSLDFPTTAGTVQPRSGGRQDGIVMKLDYNLRNMLWSTYIGGSGDDAVYSVDVDTSYNVLVCGGTNSTDLVMPSNAYQQLYGGGSADGFVYRISYHGDRILGGTYFGSNVYDQTYFVRSGSNDEVFAYGQTKAEGTTMLHNAGYCVPGSGMLLVRFLADLSCREWATVFGTPGRINLSPTAFAADVCNRVYAAGWGRDMVGYGSVTWNTQGTTGMETTPNAYSNATDGQDFYIISIDRDANHLEYATFFGEMHDATMGNYGGGDHVDGGTSRFDKLATLYQAVCASCGGTNQFPTSAGAWSDSNRSTNCNNAVFKFNITNDFPVAEFVPPPAACPPYTVNFNNTGRGSQFLWDFGDGTTSTERSPTHTYTHAGNYTVRLVATLPEGCATSDEVSHVVRVIGASMRETSVITACGDVDVQIGIEPQAGVNFRWLTTNVSDTTVPNPWVSSAGIYVIEVSDQGCTETDTFIVKSYTLIDSVIVVDPSCTDHTDGRMTLILGSGLTRENDADSLQIFFSVNSRTVPYTGWRADTVWLDNLAGGQNVAYRAIGFGCEEMGSTIIRTPNRPRIGKQISTSLCDTSCVGTLSVWVEGSTGTFSRHDTTGLCAGVYTTLLVDDNGCSVSDTSKIDIDSTMWGFRAWSGRRRILLGDTVSLFTNGNPSWRYEWSPASDIVNPSASTAVAEPTDTLVVYVVRAENANGCQAIDTVTIVCDPITCGESYFVIPNAFTPNGDGVNDQLCFDGEALLEFHIAIFNRWGEKVFESNDANKCWDGTYKGHECLPGVYTYTCHIRCPFNKESDYKGDITLIK